MYNETKKKMVCCEPQEQRVVFFFSDSITDARKCFPFFFLFSWSYLQGTIKER